MYFWHNNKCYKYTCKNIKIISVISLFNLLSIIIVWQFCEYFIQKRKYIQVNLPKRHLRVTATSDIRQLSELPIEIFNTKLPPSSGNLREAAQNHSPDGCRFGRFTCICIQNSVITYNVPLREWNKYVLSECTY